MYQQHCILETLTLPESVARVKALQEDEDLPRRSAIARRVCTEFGFFDPLGRPQLASCSKALRVLDDRGQLELPAPLHKGGHGSPRRLDRPVPPPQGVPASVEDVRGLALELVADDERRRVWNELVAAEHPQGAVCHAGAQLRYLIVSDHGILGALGFAAAALQLADRDRWIGWDDSQRRRLLHRVAALGRFLVRPAAQCRNLASKALALCLRRLPDDFRQRYGYEPLLLETFVDRSCHDGACFVAANWIAAGRTAGRGRFAPTGTAVPPKTVFLLPLRADWRAELGVPAPRLPALDPAAGLDRDAWAAQEFGGAALGDARLTQRLVRCAAVQADAPRSSFPSAAQADRALVKGYYRLLDRPADSQVTPASILAPHRARTLQRMQDQDTVLCLQDGTDLNFAERPGCDGLGLVGKNANSKGTLGLHMHSTLAVNGDGLPLGVPLIQFDAPDGRAQKDKPPAERKTQRWARGLRDCADLAAQLDGVRPVCVMDREGDVFELFAECADLGTVDLLVRAKHNRQLVKDGPKLFDAARAAPVQARSTITVERSSARRGTRRQAASKARAARTAQVEVRWLAVTLPAPERGPCRGRAPLDLALVHVRECDAPAGAEELEWFLLTSLPVRGKADAERMLRWYGLRWRIEDWHRVLKSGCKIEGLCNRRAERIERAVTINAVIAWRLLAMTLLGRDTPELPAEILFSDFELGALRDFARDRRLPAPASLGLAVRTMAILGGYLWRPNAGPPGHEIVWEGYTRLAAIAQAFERAVRLERNSDLYHRLRPDKTSGP